jgi:hypothetical protein
VPSANICICSEGAKINVNIRNEVIFFKGFQGTLLKRDPTSKNNMHVYKRTLDQQRKNSYLLKFDKNNSENAWNELQI